MRIKNTTKGFSLMEVLVAVSIMAVLAAVLVPSLIALMQESRVKKDVVKFESICTAFKTALGEPEVKKEAELIGGGGDLTVICHIDQNGLIVFGDGEVIGTSTKTLENTKLWLNSYQTVETTYQTESSEFYNQYLVFELTPKTSTTTAKCEYEILETHP